MTMRVRTAWALLHGKVSKSVDLHEVTQLALRVLPSDTDVLKHMNNGVYLSIMDLGRYDLLVRAGVYQQLRQHAIYPVVMAETITFRRSLLPWQAYQLQTRVVGYDTTSIFTEQRFVVAGEIHATGYVRGRLLRRGTGTVGMKEVAELTGTDINGRTPPDWMTEWAKAVALPPARGSYTSQW